MGQSMDQPATWRITSSYSPAQPMAWMTRTIPQLLKGNHRADRYIQDLTYAPLEMLRDRLPSMGITIDEYGGRYHATDIREGPQDRYIVLEREKAHR